MTASSFFHESSPAPVSTIPCRSVCASPSSRIPSQTHKNTWRDVGGGSHDLSTCANRSPRSEGWAVKICAMQSFTLGICNLALGNSCMPRKLGHNAQASIFLFPRMEEEYCFQKHTGSSNMLFLFPVEKGHANNDEPPQKLMITSHLATWTAGRSGSGLSCPTWLTVYTGLQLLPCKSPNCSAKFIWPDETRPEPRWWGHG